MQTAPKGTLRGPCKASGLAEQGFLLHRAEGVHHLLVPVDQRQALIDGQRALAVGRHQIAVGALRPVRAAGQRTTKAHPEAVWEALVVRELLCEPHAQRACEPLGPRGDAHHAVPHKGPRP